MTDRQISCFLEVCKEMNFTKAAEKLFIPQPAVSRYIAALEKELDVQLFVRESSRSIRLTEHGKTFYNMFNRFSSEFNTAMQEIHSKLKPLRFGYNSGWNVSSFLPHVIDQCKTEYPEFRISIDCLRFEGLSQALLDGKLDAIMSIEDYNQNYSGLEYDRIYEVPRYIFFSRPQDHFTDREILCSLPFCS